MVKYKMISNCLEEEILKGVYKETGKIPTEEEIKKRFDVSRNTVRKAVDNLVKKGCVYQVQGSGVFIKEESEEDKNFNIVNMQTMYGLSRDLKDKDIKTELIDFKIIKADEFFSKKMKCNIGDEIYFVNRIRIIDNNIYCIEYSYYNKNIINHLDEDIVNGSIYNYIMKTLNLSIGAVDRTIYADKLNFKDATIMNYEENMPCLVNENTAYLTTGKIFNYSKTILNYKSIKFKFLSNCKF